MKKQWILILAFVPIIFIIAVMLSSTEENTRAYQVSPTSLNFLPMVLKQPTLTVTPTPVSTNTPVPTNTPTPMPTSIPAGVYILPNHSHYVNSIDYLHIVGEVHNNTSNHLRFVKVVANVFNNNGQLLETDFSYIYLDSLPAGEKTCFDLLMQEPANWAYYEFETPSYWTDGEELPNLAIFNHSGSYNSTFGWYEIIGLVRNDHGSRIEYVSPIGTLYNADEIVIGCDFTFVNSTHLDPDQTSSFEITSTGRDYSDVASYRLQADGNPELYRKWLSEQGIRVDE